jgi:hypothetical protein
MNPIDMLTGMIIAALFLASGALAFGYLKNG